MPEFQGKLLVVLGGYEEDVEKLFDINPGFRSRFDKRRLHFPEWAAETAVSAMIKASARDRMKLTVEAEGEAPSHHLVFFFFLLLLLLLLLLFFSCFSFYLC